MLSPSGRSFLAYRVIGRRWIVMGEPAGAVEERRDQLMFGEKALGDAGTAGVAGVTMKEVVTEVPAATPPGALVTVQ